LADYQVARIGEVPPGKTKIVRAGKKEVVLCNVGDVYYCIDNLCTHDEGPLGEGELIGENIECPRHGAQFNVKTGEVMAMPAVVPISIYPVRTEGDQIIVSLEERC
jgi:3-phenylpropionate/trans-cinnamate dioxygenase ferredoxin subunit